jgi:Protein of unknown function (DUF3240)
MSELCLTVLCPPAAEEKLLDLLLLRPGVAVLTSIPAAAYGQGYGCLSQAEQVLGHAFATQVQVIVSIAEKQTLLDSLRTELAGAGLRFWLTPIIERGDVA